MINGTCFTGLLVDSGSITLIIMTLFFCLRGRKESVYVKVRGKRVCRHICAKSVRLVLERYSQYLISRGTPPPTRAVYVRAVEHFGRWLGRRHD